MTVAKQPEKKSLDQFDAHERETRELRAANRHLQAQLKAAKTKIDDLVEAVYTAARDAAITVGAPSPVAVPKLIAQGKGKPEFALLHTTDWQLGKRTVSYDTTICQQRVTRLGEKVAILTHIQRAEHPVDEIHVLLGGDMIENINIFPGQVYEVDSTLYEQLFNATKTLQDLLRQLLSMFRVVHVWDEDGNHGRIGRKGEWAKDDNMDRVLYRIVRESFADEKRLIWHPRPENSWHNLVEIGAYRALLIHGDEIKSFGGNTPAFGILRKTTAWSSGVTADFQDAYMGHFHTPMELTLPNGGTVYSTGSTESDNVYAAEFVAAKGKPSQRLHYIDPRRGRVTCRYQVYLDD